MRVAKIPQGFNDFRTIIRVNQFGFTARAADAGYNFLRRLGFAIRARIAVYPFCGVVEAYHRRSVSVGAPILDTALRSNNLPVECHQLGPFFWLDPCMVIC